MENEKKIIEVTYLGSDIDSKGNKYGVLDVTRPGVGTRRCAMPFNASEGVDPATKAGKIASSLDLPSLTGQVKALLLQEFQTAMLQGALTGAKAKVADLPGWILPAVYLTPNGDIYGTPKIPVGVALEGIARPNRWAWRGSLKNWKKAAKTFATYNPSLIFASSAAISGSLLELADLEGIIFCFIGKTSKGKTISLDFAASTVGGDSTHRAGFRGKWKATDNAFEVIAREGRDGLVVLDDTLLLDGKGRQQGEALARMIVDFVSGGEKRRLNNPTGDASHRVIVWASSNTPMRELLLNAGVNYDEMYDVRFIEIPADWRFGMFHSITPGMVPAEFAKALRAAAKDNYGLVNRRFLRRLAKWRDRDEEGLLKYLAQRRQEAWKALNVDGNDSVQSRTADYFILAYQAGSLARKFGAFPWARQRILRAVKSCWNKHRQHVASMKGKGDPLTVLREYIKSRSENFVALGKDVDAIAPDARARVPGFLRRRDTGEVREFILLENHLNDLVGADRISVLVQQLRMRGYLITDGKKTCPKRQLARDWRPRAYCISPNILS
ncbi:MAG: DUF927 domain-containing protein [Ferrovibrio sp.]